MAQGLTIYTLKVFFFPTFVQQAVSKVESFVTPQVQSICEV